MVLKGVGRCQGVTRCKKMLHGVKGCYRVLNGVRG